MPLRKHDAVEAEVVEPDDVILEDIHAQAPDPHWTMRLPRAGSFFAILAMGLLAAWLIVARGAEARFTTAEAEWARSQEVLTSVRTALDREREARAAAETRVEGMAVELSREREARERAEAAAAAAETALASLERWRTQTDAIDKPDGRSPLVSVADASGSRPAEQAPAAPEPLEAPPPASAPEPVPPVDDMKAKAPQPAPSPSEQDRNDADEALEVGRTYLASGDVAAARKAFERAAKLGLPEGALALGTTYDPASMAKAGVPGTGNPGRARTWYRRALELARATPHERDGGHAE